MADNFTNGNHGERGCQQQGRQNRVTEFPHMTKPVVNGCFLFRGEFVRLSRFFYHRCGENGTAQRWQKAQKGRHNCQYNAVVAKQIAGSQCKVF